MPQTLTTELQLRPIEARDNAAVARIIRQVMTEFGCVGSGFSIEDPEVDTMYEAFDNERSAFFVLEGPQGLLGCGGVAPLKGGDPSICELQKMYFLPAARGLGRGRQFLQHCIETARALGYRTMYLETVARMEQANALYRKFGFERLPCHLGATGHGGCEVFYTLTL